MRLVPRTLFGRLVLVLLSGLVAAQLLTDIVHLSERVETLYHASGMQGAERIAAALELLDRAGAQQRRIIVAAFDGPLLQVRLGQTTSGAQETPTDNARAAMLHAVLRRALGDHREFRLVVHERAQTPEPMHGHGPRGRFHAMMMGEMAFGPSFSVDTTLADGTPVAFDLQPPEEPGGASLRLLAQVTILLVSVVILSLVAVRGITRPLRVLAEAAERLGDDIERAPLPEDGPLEVAQAARAFNRMQARIGRYLHERTRFLAALSHDLKTPITRLRLRTEFVEAPELRERFEADLDEMERMVTGTLDLMRDMESREAWQPVDLQALLETLQADAEERGHTIELQGKVASPLFCRPLAVKRCLENLLGNAARYADRAWLEAEDQGTQVVVRIEDDGPGIPPEERARVFEPFYRIEASRSRDTGGSGLGLSIARNVAHMHGGGIELGESVHGGLRVTLTLPRRQAPE